MSHQSRRVSGHAHQGDQTSNQSYQQSLRFNAGLDVGYIGIGGFLWQLGKRKDKNFTRGFGLATALNGLFLLGFDIAFSKVYEKHNKTAWDYIDTLGIMGNVLSVQLRF